jgi:hypothetical protein|tara:strand:- start:184 stop:444 length:261 start_codon:yes stop_codon:yes gene_type:complete
MKFSKKGWKAFINESASFEPVEYTDYEQNDMDTDHMMVSLLQEILLQLKVLNNHMTPAKDLGSSGVERASAGIKVAENVKTLKGKQ